jgi:hypothetical protein
MTTKVKVAAVMAFWTFSAPVTAARGLMPKDFGRKLSEEQIRVIIELIKTVR